jgi:putative ABC transport system permease protein
MLRLVFTTLRRRPLRTGLTVFGVAIAVAVLALIESIGASYKSQLTRELNSMGIHLMLVPLGCPYDAAARVLKGNRLETSLPEEALRAAKQDTAVEIAAPLLLAAVPREEQGRTDMFVGLDESGIALKRWWHAETGSDRFNSTNSIILGADAAAIELRSPGDSFHSPETRRDFVVAGILSRSGMSDDSLLFVPLRTAQQMFHSQGRLTAIAIRLHDPTQISSAVARLREIPGVQVVTLTEMMGTFLNILGTVRTLLRSIAWIALCASILGISNTLLMSVAERAFEFSLFRALGASRAQLFTVVSLEAIALTLSGVLLGLLFAFSLGPINFVTKSIPFNPPANAAHFSFNIALNAVLVGIVISLIASLFPAWRAASSSPASVLKGAD